MKLNYKTFGEGEPLIILHGLLGTLDNWQTLGKRFAQQYSVYLVDQRNHGRSPHLPEMNYPVLAEDLKQFMESNWIYRSHIIGHSMGGKTAMQFALDYPDMLDKLVVVDIAPKGYEPAHEIIFEALLSVDFTRVIERSEADAVLKEKIADRSIRQFLLKNLSRNKDGGYRWKMNLEALHEHYHRILEPVSGDHPYEGPVLFIRGGQSDYMFDEDREAILKLFPQASIETVQGAGHWVHAEQPAEMARLITAFLQD